MEATWLTLGDFVPAPVAMLLSPRFFEIARRYERKRFVLMCSAAQLVAHALPVLLVLIGLMSSENTAGRFVFLLVRC